MSIFISSGEASGDHYTANLAKTLRAGGYDGDIWGMGGVESRNAGVNALWHGERLQLLGLTEVISAIPSIFSLLNEMTDNIIKRKPEAVVVCDSPDFHMRLISRLRSRGYEGRIFYLSPPSVWAWRSGRAKSLRLNVDENLPLFKFEHDYLLSQGCESYWRGHPLLEELDDFVKRPSPLAGKFDNERMIAFLPGSRGSEIKALLPVKRESADALASKGWQPVFSVAPGLNGAVREKMIAEFDRDGVLYYDGPGRDLMAAARCAVGASGTITVESLILGCYMIVTYKLNPISAAVASVVVRMRFYAMANILAGKEIFPELLQGRATAENITSDALAWLEEGSERSREIEEDMLRTRQTLGEYGVYDFWSERVMRAVHGNA